MGIIKFLIIGIDDRKKEEYRVNQEGGIPKVFSI